MSLPADTEHRSPRRKQREQIGHLVTYTLENLLSVCKNAPRILQAMEWASNESTFIPRLDFVQDLGLCLKSQDW